jgi:uncharacterized RDD family membrane protein YckC
MNENDILDIDFDDNTLKYNEAKLGKRFLTFFIDAIIIGVVNNIVTSLLIGNGLEYRYDITTGDILMYTSLSLVISILLNVYYYVLTEHNLDGRSIGKMATKTRVLSENGAKASFKEIHIRSWCRLIPFEPFSFLGSKPKGWHDTISKTIVVDESKLK